MELSRSNRERSPGYDTRQFDPNAVVNEFGRCGGDDPGLTRYRFVLRHNAVAAGKRADQERREHKTRARKPITPVGEQCGHDKQSKNGDGKGPHEEAQVDLERLDRRSVFMSEGEMAFAQLVTRSGRCTVTG